MKLSVIVPVYNTVQYLKQCIESIVSQTYKDMEIILVDDGSTDGSGEVCDYYAEKFDYIRVIHQKNGGNVAARKSGFQVAEGEYVTFMDSDDWLSEDMYAILMKEAIDGKRDIVSMGGYITFDGKRYCNVKDATTVGSYVKGINLDIFLSKMLYDEDKGTRGINPSLGGKVIKKDILAAVMENVDSRIELGGDAAVFYPCCLYAESICVIDEYKYYYRIRKESVCRSYNVSYFNKVYILYKYLEEKFQKEDKKYNLIKQLRKYVWCFLSTQIEQVFSLELKKVYLFPYKSVEKDSKIILYGAGKVGQSYHEQIKKSGYCDIVAWVDKEAYKNDKNLISPNQIAELEYSKIVIAIKSKKCAEEIICNLIDLGIDEGKIVWEAPVQMSVI